MSDKENKVKLSPEEKAAAREAARAERKERLTIVDDYTPLEPDPQYILQVNQLKKYFPIKGGFISRTVGYVKAVDGVTYLKEYALTIENDEITSAETGKTYTTTDPVPDLPGIALH